MQETEPFGFSPYGFIESWAKSTRR